MNESQVCVCYKCKDCICDSNFNCKYICLHIKAEAVDTALWRKESIKRLPAGGND